MSASRVTIVIVTFESADVLPDCLGSIALHAPGTRTIVVDNASRDRTREIAAPPTAELIASPDNEGFSKANNLGLQRVTTEFSLVLNPDARLTESTLRELLACADRNPGAAVIGPRTTFEDGRPQLSFGPDLTLLSERRQSTLMKGSKSGDPNAVAAVQDLTSRESEVDWVSGSCMLIRMAPAREVGYFDERYFLYEEDADLCLRLRKRGFSVRFAPNAVVVHALGTTMAKASVRARAAYDASHLLYYRTHRGALETAVLRLWIAIRRAFGS